VSNEVTIDVKARDRGATAGLNKIKGDLGRMLSGLKGLAVAAGADLASSLTGPLVAAAGSTVAAFASAGVAVGAFGLAVLPQLKRITDLKAELKDMPPATRDAAVAFRGARKDLMAWSDSLAPATMPIFTRALNLVGQILPKTSTLVRIAAASFDDLLGSIEHGVKGGGLDAFMSKLNKAAADSLPRLLGAVKNIGAGLAGILGAFLPFSGQLAGGLEKLTQKFATFGRNLGSNPAFQNWMRDMMARGPVILSLLGNLAQIVLNVAQALAPFTGLTLKVTAALAGMVAAIPQGVMDWLAPAITGIVLAIKAWAVVQGVLNLALAASPIGIVVVAIAALAAGLIYAYRHSATFRSIVRSAFNAVRDAATSLKGKVGPAIEAIAHFFTDTLPEAFDEGVAKLLEVVGKVDQAVKQVQEKISGLASGAGTGGGSGKGKKKGGLAPMDAFITELVIGLAVIAGKVKKFVDWLSKNFSKKWAGHLAMEGLGTVKSVAKRAIDAALGFARRAYHALLRASFPGSSVVKAAARACVRFARATYRATLRALDKASAVGRRVMGYLRSIFHPITVTINAVLGHIPKLPWQRLGGVKRMAGGGNTTLVGEEGPELVDLPPGAYVRPEATTRGRMMGQGGGGQPIVIQLFLDGKQVAEATFGHTKEIVRKKGGKGPDSSQKAWGFA
jgi:hypothetical protein